MGEVGWQVVLVVCVDSPTHQDTTTTSGHPVVMFQRSLASVSKFQDQLAQRRKIKCAQHMKINKMGLF